MSATKIFALLASLLLVAPLAAFAADDGAFTINNVEFDDPVAPGDVLEMTVTLVNSDPSYKVENVEMKAWLVDNFGDRVTEKAMISGFQVYRNADTEKVIKLSMPSDIDAGEYTLKVVAEGLMGNHRVIAEADSNIEVERLDDSLFVSDIRLSKSEYKTADNVDVAVTVMNNGADDLDNVIITISSRELGMQKSITLFGSLFSGSTQNVYFTFKLPDAAQGIYTLKASAANAIASSSATENLIVTSGKIDISNVKSADITRDLQIGKTEELQLEVANNHDVLKSYKIIVESEDLDVEATPAEFSLAPGQSKDVTVKMFASSASEHSAKIIVLENGVPVNTVTVNANVTSGLSQTAGAFFVLVLLIAGMAVYLQQKDSNGSSNGSGKEKTLYY